MVNLIMHGCNGKMGQVITKIVKEDDLYGFGKTLQFALMRGNFERPFTRREQKRLRRLVDFCVHGDDNAEDILYQVQKEIGKMMKK